MQELQCCLLISLASWYEFGCSKVPLNSGIILLTVFSFTFHTILLSLFIAAMGNLLSSNFMLVAHLTLCLIEFIDIVPHSWYKGVAVGLRCIATYIDTMV